VDPLAAAAPPVVAVARGPNGADRVSLVVVLTLDLFGPPPTGASVLGIGD